MFNEQGNSQPLRPEFSSDSISCKIKGATGVFTTRQEEMKNNLPCSEFSSDSISLVAPIDYIFKYLNPKPFSFCICNINISIRNCPKNSDNRRSILVRMLAAKIIKTTCLFQCIPGTWG